MSDTTPASNDDKLMITVILKHHAGLEFGAVFTAFVFHIVCVRFDLQSAPTHHNHSLTTDPIFGA